MATIHQPSGQSTASLPPSSYTLPLRPPPQVMATIHQPNSDIVDTFDDFMLLALGHTVYHGPWAGAVAYFDAQGESRWAHTECRVNRAAGHYSSSSHQSMHVGSVGHSHARHGCGARIASPCCHVGLLPARRRPHLPSLQEPQRLLHVPGS